jgi:polyhydroxybutyrate depolymerase
VPVLYFHGTGDTVVPYAGDTQYGWPSATATFEGWAKRDGCTGASKETFRKDDVHCDTYDTCAQGSVVTLCTIDDGGHTWPGGFPIPSGKTTTNISATDAMWTFFQAHPLN